MVGIIIGIIIFSSIIDTSIQCTVCVFIMSFLMEDSSSSQVDLFAPSLSAYTVGSKIGMGTFGLSTLWLAHPNGNSDVLVILRKTEIDQLSSKDLESLQYEMMLSSQLLHPSIMSFRAAFVNKYFIWTIYPFFNYGSCHDVIHAEFTSGLPFLVVAHVLQCVLSALEYLHRKGYVHRALKASHILLNSNGKVCLTGLRYCLSLNTCDGLLETGIAHVFPEHAVQVLPWIAPEVLKQNLEGYTQSSDIYSLGITAVELTTGSIPYATLEPTEILYQKLNGMVPQLPEHVKTAEIHLDVCDSSGSLPHSVSSSGGFTFSPSHTSLSTSMKKVTNLQQFVDQCVQMNADSRPTASQLKNSLYLKCIKKKVKDDSFLLDLLKPLNPILEFVEDEPSNSQEDLVDKISDASLEEDWTF